MNPFVFSTTSQIVFRPGASAEIGGLVKPKLGNRPCSSPTRGCASSVFVIQR